MMVQPTRSLYAENTTCTDLHLSGHPPSYVTHSYFFFELIFMVMLVYWESTVWSIIANGVVYVNYKNAYKTKLINAFTLSSFSSKSICV